MRNLFGEKISVIAIIEKVSRLKQRHTNGPFEMAKWTISSQIDSQCIKFWSFSKVTHWTCHDGSFSHAQHFIIFPCESESLCSIKENSFWIWSFAVNKRNKTWIQGQSRTQIQSFPRKAKPKKTLISGKPKVMP